MKSARKELDMTLKAILDSAQNRGLAIFVGAAISYEKPSYAPDWYSFRDAILYSISQNLLDGSNSTFQQSFKYLIESSLRPEIVLEAIDRFGRGMSQIIDFAKVINAGKPNRYHHGISCLADAGYLTNIITTNWDSYIEDALQSSGAIDRFHIVRTDHDAPPDKGKNLLLHIHGAIRSSKFIQGGHYRIGFGLAPKVAKLLKDILSQNDCLFVGFSGNDWDVFSILKDTLQRSSNIFFWLYRSDNNITNNLRYLLDNFPDQVFPIRGDLSILNVLCKKLDLSFNNLECETECPDLNQMLNEAAKSFGNLQAALVFAFSCSAIGKWLDASYWCEYAQDLAFKPETHQILRGEIYRLSSAVVACAGNISIAEFYMSSALQEYSQANTNPVTRIKIEILHLAHKGLIWLCNGSFEKAEGILWEAIKHLRAEKAISSLMVISGAEFPMLNGAVVSLYAIAQAICKDDVSETIIIHQDLILHHTQHRNYWGYLGNLLSLALCYYRKGRYEEAIMALNDCINESQGTGLLVLNRAAKINLGIVQKKVGLIENYRSPIVDPITGWHLVPDPFSVIIHSAESGL